MLRPKKKRSQQFRSYFCCFSESKYWLISTQQPPESLHLNCYNKYLPPVHWLIGCCVRTFSEGVSAETIATPLYLPLMWACVYTCVCWGGTLHIRGRLCKILSRKICTPKWICMEEFRGFYLNVFYQTSSPCMVHELHISFAYSGVCI